MIDLHTHTILSDGELIASELVRRAQVKGYRAIALADHCDWSNVDIVVPHIAKVSETLNKHWNIKVIPGVEITHVPLEEIEPLVKFARGNGAKIVVGHGETMSEPVIKGTNRSAIESRVDILAHPGNISEEDAVLARKNGVCLEITTRKLHCATNKHVAKIAIDVGAKLVINTDAHSEDDLITKDSAVRILTKAGLKTQEIDAVFKNSQDIVNKL